MNKPKISIIMGAYNCGRTVENAIDSIVKQTYTDWEFIICDDGSDDNTWKMLQKICSNNPQFILLKNDKNRGLAATLNRCIDAATSEYLARQDADDVSLPNRFEEQMSYLDKNKNVSVLGTYLGLFSEGKGRWGHISLPELPQKSDWISDTAVGHASVIMKKSDVVAVGKYDPTALRIEDYDLWTRMVSKGYVIRTLPKILYDVHWNLSDYKRKKIKYRFVETKVKFHAYRRLRVSVLSYFFLLKPILGGLMPLRLLYYFHKSRFAKSK